MDAIEKRAREILDSHVDGYWLEEQGRCVLVEEAVAAIIDALTRPEGHVVVTRNEAGQAVAVTRQDDEGRILSVIAEFEYPQWQPIESAPKTTRSILVWCPERQNQYMVYWDDRYEGEWRTVGGGTVLTEAPTHWQPLPAPPEVKNVND